MRSFWPADRRYQADCLRLPGRGSPTRQIPPSGLQLTRPDLDPDDTLDGAGPLSKVARKRTTSAVDCNPATAPCSENTDPSDSKAAHIFDKLGLRSPGGHSGNSHTSVKLACHIPHRLVDREDQAGPKSFDKREKPREGTSRMLETTPEDAHDLEHRWNHQNDHDRWEDQ